VGGGSTATKRAHTQNVSRPRDTRMHISQTAKKRPKGGTRSSQATLKLKRSVKRQGRMDSEKIDSDLCRGERKGGKGVLWRNLIRVRPKP